MFRLFLILLMTIVPLYSQQHTSAIVAVSDLVGQGIAQSEVKTVSEQLRAEILKTGYFRIMERTQMQEILKEQGFQQTGCTADSCAIEVGQLLGVNNIIVGSLGTAGSYTAITLRILDVQTGEVTITETVNSKGGIDNMIESGIHQAAVKPISGFLKTISAAIIEAAKTGNIKEVERLLQRGADVNSSDTVGDTPLREAAGNGYTKLVDFLLSKGANVNAPDSSGWTPFNHAVYKCHKDIVKELIEKGAWVSMKDWFGNTALSWAAEGCDTGMVRLLLKAGAEVNAENHIGDTPLNKAINYGGSFDVIKLLLSKGADMNSLDFQGNTPLHSAVMREREDVVKLLLAKGTVLNKTDYLGMTPLDLAYGNPHRGIEKILQKAGAKEGTFWEKQLGLLFSEVGQLQCDSITCGILKTQWPVARINEIVTKNPEKANFLVPDGDYDKFSHIEEIIRIYCPVDSQGNVDVSRRRLQDINSAFFEWKTKTGAICPSMR
jgi:ankyrin repeat protein